MYIIFLQILSTLLITLKLVCACDMLNLNDIIISKVIFIAVSFTEAALTDKQKT